MMLAQASLGDVIIAAITAVPTTLVALATLFAVLRGRGRAREAHDQLAEATVNTYNAVAEVASKVGANVSPVEPSTSEVPPQ